MRPVASSTAMGLPSAVEWMREGEEVLAWRTEGKASGMEWRRREAVGGGSVSGDTTGVGGSDESPAGRMSEEDGGRSEWSEYMVNADWTGESSYIIAEHVLYRM